MARYECKLEWLRSYPVVLESIGGVVSARICSFFFVGIHFIAIFI